MISCGGDSKETASKDTVNVVGDYEMVSNGEVKSFLSLKLKDNGTGFLRNSEGYEYTGEYEFCTFDWEIAKGEYKIKDGTYDYVSISSLSNGVYNNFLSNVWIIVESSNGAIELKPLTQSEELSDVLNYRKKK